MVSTEFLKKYTSYEKEITDTERLDFILQGYVCLKSGEYYHVASPKGIGPLEKTPRLAIDAAMNQEKGDKGR